MWVTDTENEIYTILYTRLRTALLAKYPNLNVTNIESDNTETQFPTVYIHFLPFAERGNDLDNTEINAVVLTVQYEVSTNGSNKKAVLNEISNQVLTELKKLRFNISTANEAVSTRIDVERLVGRGHRLVGSADSFIET